MTGYLIVAELASATGLDKDNFVNTFFCDGDVLADADLDALLVKFADFYNVVPTGQAASIAQSLSLHLSRAADACKLRGTFVPEAAMHGNVKGDPTTWIGSPQREIPFTLAARGAGEPTLPSEVALKITFEGLGREDQPVEGPGGAHPRARYTGGIYLGPFTSASLSGDTIARPPQALIDRCLQAVADLKAATEAGANPRQLSVWSRKSGLAHHVFKASCDNAWDTIRRRGEAATARTRVIV